MNKLCVFGIFLMLLSTTAVLAIRDIDYKDRCLIVQEATDFRPERDFGNIGIWGRFVESHFDSELNKTIYRSVLDCFLPIGNNRPVEEPAPQSVIVPEPCVPVEECHDVPVSESPSWECKHWSYHPWKHCTSYGWVCEEGLDLECVDWDGCGPHRHCDDWECQGTAEECTMTGCEA